MDDETIERMVKLMAEMQENGRLAIRAARGLQARLDCAEVVLASGLAFARLLPPGDQARLTADVDRKLQAIVDRFANAPDSPIDAMVTASVNRYRTALET